MIKSLETLIDVKHAVESAVSYFQELMPVHGVRLEEVEPSEDERFWRVTLSGVVPVPEDLPPGVDPTVSTLAQFFKGSHERVYKLFTVDAATGAVRSMRIRQI